MRVYEGVQWVHYGRKCMVRVTCKNG